MRGRGIPVGEGLRIAFAAGAALLLGLHPSWLAPHGSAAGWVAVGISAWPIFREALEHLRERRMTMELSMGLALVCAAGLGEFFTALIITAFVLAAEILEDLTVDRGRRAISDLLDVLPARVEVRRGEESLAVDLGELCPGDVVRVKPGGRVPVDGRVLGGHSHVDESSITGEPMPVAKGEGDRVHAGSINQAGALEVLTERVGRDTAFGRIVEAVEVAEQSRAPIQKIADRLAGYLVVFALGCAAFTWVLTRDARSTLSVILVAGACGIAAGTPLAVLGAIGRAARLGAIVKGGVYLEMLGRVDTVVLDKTGTLTLGRPEVVAILPAGNRSEEEVLVWAAFAEQHSEHPLGEAILRRAEGRVLEAPLRFGSTPGRGVVALGSAGEVRVGSAAHLAEAGLNLEGFPGEPGDIHIALDGLPLGSLRVADAIRPEAEGAVAALHAMGLATVLLTGDPSEAGRTLGRSLGIPRVETGLLPVAKQACIAALKAEGHRVAMVGDGVNDAPALVEAHVGIAMGSGTDVARETADVVLIGNDLGKLVETLVVARSMRRIILQNFAGTLIVDGIGVALAAFGLLNPLLAAFIHVASEMAFILNATRLLTGRPHSRRTTHAIKGCHRHP